MVSLVMRQKDLALHESSRTWMNTKLQDGPRPRIGHIASNISLGSK